MFSGLLFVFAFRAHALVKFLVSAIFSTFMCDTFVKKKIGEKAEHEQLPLDKLCNDLIFASDTYKKFVCVAVM